MSRKSGGCFGKESFSNDKILEQFGFGKKYQQEYLENQCHKSIANRIREDHLNDVDMTGYGNQNNAKPSSNLMGNMNMNSDEQTGGKSRKSRKY